MFDVIPPSFANPTSPRRLAVLRGARASRSRPSKNVLKIAWKLPARLRRPVRQQLQSERRARRKKILAAFSRRPLNTQLLEDVPARNVGAEYHTGDVYREAMPQLSLVAPPYVGAVVKGVLNENRSAFATPAADPVVSLASSRTKLDRPTRAPGRSEFVQPRSLELSETRGVVTPPKRKLALPFSLNILPGWLMGRDSDQTPLRPSGYAGFASFEEKSKVAKKKIHFRGIDAKSLVILLVGCLVAAGVVANLRSLGQAARMAGSVRGLAAQAWDKLTQAQAALAETDFAASETAFADAQALLLSAQREMDTGAGKVKAAARFVDVTGAVRSGTNLLEAGEALTVAGQHTSRGLQQLLASQPTLVDAIKTAREEFAVAGKQMTVAEEALKNVNEALLPTDVQSSVEGLTLRLPTIRGSLERFVRESDLLLAVLGAERDRDYLVLFANPHELRPVGGFLGSLALLNVDRGEVEAVDVQTVYYGDGQLKEFIAPPDPLLPIVSRWYLRDSNWFVDFAVNARKAAQFFEKEGGPTVDGVILMTPAVIQEWLAFTGPITVPGYDEAVSADNFFAVTQREVTYEYDRGLNRPKQFLADLTPLLLNRVLEAKGGDALQMLGALTRSLSKKDLLLYFRDEEAQTKVVEAGWAGSLPKGAPGFLMVNNANIGGHKSDQFIEQEIDYRIEVGSSGAAEVVLTVRREHRGLSEREDFAYPDGEDPSTKDNIAFQRVLVPYGAELLEVQGFSSAGEIPRMRGADEDVLPLVPDADIAEWQRGQVRHASGTLIGQEAGYTFFANWMVTKPGQTTVGLYRYRLPNFAEMPGLLNAASRASAYVGKQPGAARTSVRVSIRLPDGTNIIGTRPDDGITRISDREFAYRGALTRDLVTGAVFEKE